AVALARGDGGVEADADHVDDLLLRPDRHAGQAHVGEEAAHVDVDVVLDRQLLRLAPADVGFGFVVLHVQLDGSAVDPARLVDAVHGHLDADEGGLAPRRTGTRKRLQRADLVGLGLAEGGPPRPRYQRRGSERYGAAR